IVPYNFFLAAGLGSGGELIDMRRGLRLSFGVGLLVTASIVVVGVTASGFVSFEDLAVSLEAFLGEYGRLVLGAGLFAAGFSSATTAPLAAAMAGRELLSTGDKTWRSGGSAFRATWLVVVVIGLLVALLQLDIVGVILAAQVINGLLLPFIAAVIFFLANRKDLLGEQTNTWWQNLIGILVLGILFYKTGEFLLTILLNILNA
ncbi:MAG: divalent metal cation transporter, partial [Lewinella sp.]